MKPPLIVPCPSELHGGMVCCQSPYEVRATDLFWGHQSLAELKVELRCLPLPDRLAENPNTSPAIIKFQMRLSEKVERCYDQLPRRIERTRSPCSAVEVSPGKGGSRLVAL